MTHERELHWLETAVGVVVRGDRSILSVGGDDAQEWIQGQLTNQCEGAGPGDAVYGFVLTLKGRVMADAWALFHEDGIWLDVPRGQVAALLERLDRYIIMEDVDLVHREDLRSFAAQGPRAAEVCEGGWPVDGLGFGGRQWVLPEADFDAAFEAAVKRAQALGGGFVSDRAWAHAHIVVSMPRFGVDFGDWTYPQETGLTPLAVSFNKGCYIGQETVVMLENRGKAPKTLWRWTLEGSEAPPAGTPILRGGEEVGKLTSAAAVGHGVLALGFLKRGHDDERDGFTILEQTAHAVGPVSEAPSVVRR